MGILHGSSTVGQGAKVPQSQALPTWAVERTMGALLQACCPEQAKFLPCQGLRQAELENKDLIWRRRRRLKLPLVLSCGLKWDLDQILCMP